MFLQPARQAPPEDCTVTDETDCENGELPGCLTTEQRADPWPFDRPAYV